LHILAILVANYIFEDVISLELSDYDGNNNLHMPTLYGYTDVPNAQT